MGPRRATSGLYRPSTQTQSVTDRGAAGWIKAPLSIVSASWSVVRLHVGIRLSQADFLCLGGVITVSL